MIQRIHNKLNSIVNQFFMNKLPSISGLVRNPRNQIIMYHGVVEHSIGLFN